MLAIAGGGIRTGSTAVWQIMRDVVIMTDSGHAPHGDTAKGTQNIFKWALSDEWVVLKYHGVYEPYTRYLDRLRAVVTYRNHLDVVTSIMHYKDDPFETVVDHRASFHSNMDAYREWNELPIPVLNLRYETDVVNNRTRTVARIARFLDIDMDEDMATAIARKWSLEANKRRARQRHPAGSYEFMSPRHIWSDGQIGKYREELTPEQIRQVYAIPKVRRWQEEMGYEIE